MTPAKFEPIPPRDENERSQEIRAPVFRGRNPFSENDQKIKNLESLKIKHLEYHTEKFNFFG